MKLNRTFEIIEKDWYKRRAPDTKMLTPISADIPYYRATPNHMCDMIVTYSDGSKKTLLARVIQNNITKAWTVDGMEIAVKVIDL
jgi:hypothetical protein